MSGLKVLFVGFACCSLNAQMFMLDDFETGDFSVSGASSFSQALPEQNVLGGVRTVNLSNTSFDTASVSDGTLTLVRNENSILRLTYGSFGDANTGQHLHFDAGPGGETTLDIEVPLVRREPLTVHARFTSFTLDGGVPTHRYSTAEFNFFSDEPLRKSIELGDFIGDADFRDIAGFELRLGSIDGIRATLDLSGATLTPIPEPGIWATLTAAGLLSFALLRPRAR